MYGHSVLYDLVYNDRLEELRREAEHQRLVDLARGPRRPIRIRVRVAGWLYSLARRVEGQPSAMSYQLSVEG